MFAKLALGVLVLTCVLTARAEDTCEPGMPPQLSPACLQDGGGFVSALGGCQDQETGLVWSTLPAGGDWLSVEQIAARCGASQEGGFDDWRIATKNELVDVAEHGAMDHLKLACTLEQNYFNANAPFMSSTTTTLRGPDRRPVPVAVSLENPPRIEPYTDRQTHLTYYHMVGFTICVRQP